MTPYLAPDCPGPPKNAEQPIFTMDRGGAVSQDWLGWISGNDGQSYKVVFQGDVGMMMYYHSKAL